MKVLRKLLLATPFMVTVPFLLNLSAPQNQNTFNVGATQDINTATLSITQNTFCANGNKDVPLTFNITGKPNIILNSRGRDKVYAKYFLMSIANDTTTYQMTSGWWNKNSSTLEIFIWIGNQLDRIAPWESAISQYLYLEQKENPPLFSTQQASFKFDMIDVLGTNEWLQNIHGDVIYSKDSATPFTFTDTDDFFTYFPAQLKNYSLTDKNIKSIPCITMAYAQQGSAYEPIFKYLKQQSVYGDIDCTYYDLDKFLRVNSISQNVAHLGVANWFKDNDCGNHTMFSDKIVNKANFKLYYKTCDLNDNNREINLCETFTFTDLEQDIDVPINKGVFTPLGLEMLEYNDTYTYIQPDFTTIFE